MDTVTIDGVEYVKASVLAKKLRYTSDYIGQLCRGKKVDAHLVGRTWYVYPPSLEGHKSTRYAELRSGEKVGKISSEATSSRINVEAPVTKTVVKSQSPNFHNRVFWKPTAYESDDAELMPSPVVKESAQPLKMPITLADSERVRVAATSKNVTMVSQPLPAIALSGTLRVQDFSPEFTLDTPADSFESVDKSSDFGQPASLKEAVEPTEVSTEEGTVRSRSTFLRRLESHSVQHEPSKSLGDIRPPAPVSMTKPVTGTTEDHSLRTPSLAVRPKELTSNDPSSSLFFKLVIAPAVTLLVAGVAATLLAVENVTVVGGGEQVASLRFDPALLVAFFTW